MQLGAGSREDKGFPSEPKENFDKHNRARDDNRALVHVIWESMGRLSSQLEASPFLFRFFFVSLSFLYRFFSVSLSFLYRFRLRFFSVSTTVSFPFLFKKRNDKETITAFLRTLSIYIYIYIYI